MLEEKDLASVEKKMEVLVYLEDGRIAVAPGAGMNLIEAHTMLTIGQQTIEKSILEQSRIVDPSKGIKGLVNFS